MEHIDNEASLDVLRTYQSHIIVDFWASWCPPCQSYEPVFEAVSESMPEVVFAKVELESTDSKKLAHSYQVRSIPTTLFFEDGELVFRHVGAMTEEQLIEAIARVFN